MEWYCCFGVKLDFSFKDDKKVIYNEEQSIKGRSYAVSVDIWDC